MINKTKILSSLVGLGFFLALTSNVGLAGTRTKTEMSASAAKPASQFQKIEQPWGLKLAVALGGLGLIGAELWWFMFSNPNSQHLKPSSSDRVSKPKSSKTH